MIAFAMYCYDSTLDNTSSKDSKLNPRGAEVYFSPRSAEGGGGGGGGGDNLRICPELS